MMITILFNNMIHEYLGNYLLWIFFQPKPPKTKKYVIIGSFVLLSTALIVVAILVGIHIYVEAQKVIKVNFSQIFDYFWFANLI